MRWRPGVVAVADRDACRALEAAVEKGKTNFISGKEGAAKIAGMEGVDCVLVAIAGASALEPVLASVEAGKHVAVASKEPMVMAGKLIMRRAGENKAKVIPVDSEANAIFQCVDREELECVEKVTITGSGGPFRGKTPAEMEDITPEQAIAHPIWGMGRKISVDSATMMNKALEVIEISNMFNFDQSMIGVAVHPQARVHAMVEWRDGSVTGIMGTPDMRIPIQHAITYPERIGTPVRRMNIFESSPLTFEEPDIERFPALGYGYEALKRGGTAPAVLNAADEEAVACFLSGKIGFLQIACICADVLRDHIPVQNPSIREILDADRWARNEVKRAVEN